MAKTSWDVTFLRKSFPQILYCKNNFCNRNKMRLHFWNSCLQKKAFVCEEKAEAFDFFQNMQLKRN